MPKRLIRTNVAGSQTVGAALGELRERLGLVVDFPEDAASEAARSAERGIDESRLTDRRGIPFVTIDPASSRDLDQAVHIEREGEGYLVRYAISAVGLFVEPGGALDRETHRRAQTVYGPDGSIPLHPGVLSHGAASLLPNEDRPAYLWYLHLNPDGELRHTWVELALVRSVAKLSYEHVQAAIDGHAVLGTSVPEDFTSLLEDVGRLRLEREAARGGISLALPEQVVEGTPHGYRLAFRGLTRVERWNAQISLATGMAAARLMSQADIGILRTVPPAGERDVERLRSIARALELEWPEDQSYSDFARGVSADSPDGAAFLTEATSLFRGAGYEVLPVSEQGEPGRHRGSPFLEHAALAARYAHVTAPLRRLVDRYGLEICRCICAGEDVPSWVRDGLGGLPATMTASARVASNYENGSIDAIEALILAGREGETFPGVVVDVFAGRERTKMSDAVESQARGVGTVMLSEPAVLAKIFGDRLRRGRKVEAILQRAEIATSTVEFRQARRETVGTDD